MTRTASKSSNDSPATQPRKRIRDNHNELERIRRNHQKAQLDALRSSLPFADMDERASMVSIIVRSREYIEVLEKRVFELQNLLGMPRDAGLEAKIAAAETAKSENTVSDSAENRPRLPSISTTQGGSEQFLIHHGVQFYNPNLTSSAPVVAVSPVQKRPSSPLIVEEMSDATLNADLLMSFLTESHPELLRCKRLSSDDELFMKTFRQRRESSVLLPLNSADGGVVVQKRDSLSSLFSGLLPDVVEESALGGDVKCKKCSRGVNSMIMVDCDRCRRWFHLGCAGVDATAIPTFWTCNDCVNHNIN